MAKGTGKGRKRGSKGQSRGSKAGQGKAKGQAKAGLGLPGVPLVPGVVRSWEDFSEAALRDYLAATIEQISEDLDEQEQAFRGSN